MFKHFDNHKINFMMLAKVLGWLLMIEGAFMLFPALVSLLYEETDWDEILFCALGTLSIGYILTNCLHPSRSKMGKREGFLLTASTWIVFSLFGMLPFLFCTHPLSIVDAFFEAMAGFTTTGCTAYEDVGVLSHGINLWRAMMQWIGGMGIILFTLAVLPTLNSSGGMQMFNAEVTGITHEKIRPRVSQTAMSLWGVYLVLTLLCAICLWLGPMSLFESICYAFGTLSTGGVVINADGINYWNSPYVYSVITAFMFLGGTSFSVIYFTFASHTNPFRNNTVFRAYVIIALGMSFLLFIARLHAGTLDGVMSATLMPLFMTVSTMTSTGYALPNVHLWSPMVFVLMMPLMFFGACAGSTAGGAKIDRLLVLIKYIRNALKRSLQPNQVTSIEVNGKVLPNEVVSKTIAFISLYTIVPIFSAIILSWMGVSIVDSYFSSYSCMANLGLGADISGDGMLLSDMPSMAKITLSACMLIGRLEIFTIFVIFTPGFWQK